MVLRHTLSTQQKLALPGIFLLGCVISFGAFFFLKDRTVQREQNKFAVTASNSALALKRAVEATHNKIKSIASLYDSSDYVDRQQFQRFVTGILKERTEIIALEWVPKVNYTKRDDFINAARYDGYENFEIREHNTKGRLVRARKRGVYYPVFFVEPVARYKHLLGYNRASNTGILKDLKASRDSVNWVISNLPVSEYSRNKSRNKRRVIHMLDPVYTYDMTNSTISDRRFYHKGFAVGAIDVNVLMHQTLSDMLKEKEVSVYLFDKSANRTAAPLGLFGEDRAKVRSGQSHKQANRLVYDMRLGQRDWSVVVVNHQVIATGWVPYTAFLALLVITLFCTYFVYYEITQHEHIKQVVRERTAELKEHKDHLEDMVRNRTEIIAQQAEELKIQLEREQELNEMQRGLVSLASHEFRTPLAIIDTSAHRLERRAQKGTTDNMIPLIGKINKAVERMTYLMESTLSAAQIEKGKLQVHPADCNIKQLLIDCKERQQELSQHHTILINIEDLPDCIIADSISLDQIFTNLLSNAVKYSPTSDRISLVGWTEDNMVAVSVSDSGIGIDEEDQQQMFNRFFRAKTAASIPGTGIGLNIVKTLVEEHGGRIELTSEVGKGTTFTVYLPINGPAGIIKKVSGEENKNSPKAMES